MFQIEQTFLSVPDYVDVIYMHVAVSLNKIIYLLNIKPTEAFL